ncbi:putative candidate xylanase, Glycoside hydrolase family 10 [Lyophyllum shimeji]|uniref:Candidate xylanase, Glycoside hydrolase family 10 n=1 Tax=Lyophyllum shimeji TaxID=47721 RepID=A0A9P3PQP4_LYOSH|nr:putative candidate xylanase, Glycoside hydrolase family 10 [Lyophyllum shimeji]
MTQRVVLVADRDIVPLVKALPGSFTRKSTWRHVDPVSESFSDKLPISCSGLYKHDQIISFVCRSSFPAASGHGAGWSMGTMRWYWLDRPDGMHFEFSQITPGNSMKWDATEPTRGTFTFTKADQVVALAQKNDQLIRGHNCVWNSQLPSWVTAGNFNARPSRTSSRLNARPYRSHSPSALAAEPLNDVGTWRTSVFYNTLGSSFVSILQAARAADPAAKLYIDDYNTDGTGAKSTAMGHLIVRQVPSTIQANIAQFAALGVEVAIAELDIRMTSPTTPALLAQQKKDYRTGAALPWDENLVKKPAYDGIVEGFTS